MSHLLEAKDYPELPNCIHCNGKLVWAGESTTKEVKDISFECEKCLAYGFKPMMVISYHYYPNLEIRAYDFIIDNYLLKVRFSDKLNSTYLYKILPDKDNYRNKVVLDYQKVFSANYAIPVNISSKESVANTIKNLLVFS